MTANVVKANAEGQGSDRPLVKFVACSYAAITTDV